MNAIVIPNNTLSFPIELEATRTCELAVECWSLKYDVYDKDIENDNLRSYARRLKTALTKANDDQKYMREINQKMRSEINMLQERCTSQDIIINELSSTKVFHSRVLSHERQRVKTYQSIAEQTKIDCDNLLNQRYAYNLYSHTDLLFRQSREHELEKEISRLNDILTKSKDENNNLNSKCNKYMFITSQLEKSLEEKENSHSNSNSKNISVSEEYMALEQVT